MSSFVRNYKTPSGSGCTILHSHQQCIRFSVALHSNTWICVYQVSTPPILGYFTPSLISVFHRTEVFTLNKSPANHIFLLWIMFLRFWYLYLYISLLLLFSHSVVSDSTTPWSIRACQLSLSFTISRNLLKLMSIKSVCQFTKNIL